MASIALNIATDAFQLLPFVTATVEDVETLATKGTPGAQKKAAALDIVNNALTAVGAIVPSTNVGEVQGVLGDVIDAIVKAKNVFQAWGKKPTHAPNPEPVKPGGLQPASASAAATTA